MISEQTKQLITEMPKPRGLKKKAPVSSQTEERVLLCLYILL